MGNVTGMRKCAGCGVTLPCIFVAQRGYNEQYHALGYYACPTHIDYGYEALYVLMSMCIHVYETERDSKRKLVDCNTYYECLMYCIIHR